jgi:phospholipase C
MKFRSLALAALVIALVNSCATTPTPPPAPAGPLGNIDTIVVIYAENRSFDNLFGLFPRANGIASAFPASTRQLDHDGKVLPHLPPVYARGKPDSRFPTSAPNGPFRADQAPYNFGLDQRGPGNTHRYYQHIEQINGGTNNKFVAMNDSGAWAMGYFDGSSLKMWDWAKRYTLADNFFMGAFGGSFLNHQWLICACTPPFPDAPEKFRAQLDDKGHLKRRPESAASVLEGPVRTFDGNVTPDGYVVNTAQPPYQPSGFPPAAGQSLDLADMSQSRSYPTLPPQTAKTIGDTLTARGVSWAWYAEGWNRAVADGRQPPEAKRTGIYSEAEGSPIFQPHHQAFNFYARFAPGTPDRERHLKDGDDFLAAIEKGTLPAVSFYKPAGKHNVHPDTGTVRAGDEHIAGILEKLEKSPQWQRMLVIVTYDENGGYWDHVAPPRGEGYGDRWGPGSRIPAILVGPTVKKGYIDHTVYDTTSILKLITRRFSLEPLPGVRRRMGDLTNALQ